jgi:penicillin-binding protein 2
MVIERRKTRGINDRKRKTLLLTLLIAFLFSVLWIRIWYLQILKGEKFIELSENNRIRIMSIKAHRGRILDRDKRVIVDNRPSFNLSFVPEDVKGKDFQKILDRLNQKIPLKREEVLKKVKSASPFKSMIIKRDIDRDAMAFIVEQRFEVPWLDLGIEPMRSYKYKDMAAHLIGYLGEIDERGLRRSRRTKNSYQLGDLIGQFGMEKIYETQLKGENGKKQVEVDAYGRELKLLIEEDFTPGNHLILTIDLRLQELAEKLFADKEGSIVVMNPKNGEILTMVSKPSFDPNLFAKGITREDWQSLIKNETHPLQNRTIQGQYPPGSVYKIVTAVAALEEGVITPNTSIFDKGYYVFGRRVYRDWKKGGHGTVNLHKAIVESCDTYFYQVGVQLGIDVLARYARGFGLGKPTGIDLKNEKAGIVPSTRWKKRARKEPWYPGETVSAAIGQGYNLVTPIQIANLVSSVANGGIRYRPRIVKQIESPGGSVLYQSQPEIIGKLPARPETLEIIRKALLGVVNGNRGTGRRARIKDILVAGKTGTVQVIRKKENEEEPKDYQEKLPRKFKDHGWFVCFAPFEDPELVVVVLGEHGGKHGSYYAPIAKALIEEYFKLKKAS